LPMTNICPVSPEGGEKKVSRGKRGGFSNSFEYGWVVVRCAAVNSKGFRHMFLGQGGRFREGNYNSYDGDVKEMGPSLV